MSITSLAETQPSVDDRLDRIEHPLAPGAIASTVDRRVAAAFRGYFRAVREQDETEEACAALGVTFRSPHPLSSAIIEAAERVMFAEANLREQISRHHPREIVIHEGRWAYIALSHLRLGRVGAADAPLCVQKFAAAIAS